MIAGHILLAIATAVLIILLGRWLGHKVSSPQTRAFTALVDAWRFGDEASREAAFDGIYRALELDTPNLDPAERKARRARMMDAARTFDERYGRYHWGVRVAALLAHHDG